MSTPMSSNQKSALVLLVVIFLAFAVWFFWPKTESPTSVPVPAPTASAPAPAPTAAASVPANSSSTTAGQTTQSSSPPVVTTTIAGPNIVSPAQVAIPPHVGAEYGQYLLFDNATRGGRAAEKVDDLQRKLDKQATRLAIAEKALAAKTSTESSARASAQTSTQSSARASVQAPGRCVHNLNGEPIRVLTEVDGFGDKCATVLVAFKQKFEADCLSKKPKSFDEAKSCAQALRP